MNSVDRPEKHSWKENRGNKLTEIVVFISVFIVFLVFTSNAFNAHASFKVASHILHEDLILQLPIVEEVVSLAGAAFATVAAGACGNTGPVRFY